MNLTIAQIHRINQAHISIAQSFASGGPSANGNAINGSPLRTFKSKLTLARNLSRLREALEPVEEILTKERSRLLGKTREHLPDAGELGPDEAALFLDFVKEANNNQTDIALEPIPYSDLNTKAFNGPASIEAISALDGVVFTGEPPPEKEENSCGAS